LSPQRSSKLPPYRFLPPIFLLNWEIYFSSSQYFPRTRGTHCWSPGFFLSPCFVVSFFFRVGAVVILPLGVFSTLPGSCFALVWVLFPYICLGVDCCWSILNYCPLVRSDSGLGFVMGPIASLLSFFFFLVSCVLSHCDVSFSLFALFPRKKKSVLTPLQNPFLCDC